VRRPQLLLQSAVAADDEAQGGQRHGSVGLAWLSADPPSGSLGPAPLLSVLVVFRSVLEPTPHTSVRLVIDAVAHT
jgi:hypothetical protein